MLTVFLFDERGSTRTDELQAALGELSENVLLWVALRDPTDEEIAIVRKAFSLEEGQADRLRKQPAAASLVDAGTRLHVTFYAAGSEAGEPVLRPVECVLGENWVITAHGGEIDVLNEFLERAEGGSQIGVLDSPTFVAAVAGWVAASYFRAFEKIEEELEELDARVMSDAPKNAEEVMTRLVELRRSIGTLRRALSPHREIFISLGHPELDQLSTENSAARFAASEHLVSQALDAAREAKESTRGSYDLLVAEIGQRTNDVMKILTLVTVILLPATVIAGIMGMNFRVDLFDVTWMFWVVVAAMLAIAAVVLSVARSQHWI